MKLPRRLLLVLLLVGVVGLIAWLLPANTSRATATVMMNGVPHLALVRLSPLDTDDSWRSGETTNQDGWCQLTCPRKTYNTRSAIQGILATPLSTGAWKQLLSKNRLEESTDIPIGKCQIQIHSISRPHVPPDPIFIIEISPDPDKNHFVFELSENPKQYKERRVKMLLRRTVRPYAGCLPNS